MVLRLSFGRRVRWLSNDQNAPHYLRVPDDSLRNLIFPLETFKSSILKMFSTVSPASQFVDVGVNIGQTMLEVARLLPKIEYFGFEPNIEALCCAKEIANTCKINAHFYPWACSSESAPRELYAESFYDSSATLNPSIRPNTYESVTPQAIAAYPLDQILVDRLEDRFIMKIDVEGGENEVLKGSLKLLMQKRPLMLCEVLNAHRESETALTNYCKLELEQILNDMRYKIYRVQLSAQDREEFRGLKHITSFQKSLLWKHSQHQCDYIFIPREISFDHVLDHNHL